MLINSYQKEKVVRKYDKFDLSEVYDEYDKSMVNMQQLLDKIFIANGRLYRHERILCWFPRYVEYFVENEELLMNNDDILPITWKYYIAIMAVSCYECDY